MPAENADWLDADCVVMETDLSPVCDLMEATNKSWVTERGERGRVSMCSGDRERLTP